MATEARNLGHCWEVQPLIRRSAVGAEERSEESREALLELLSILGHLLVEAVQLLLFGLSQRSDIAVIMELTILNIHFKIVSWDV